MVLIFGDYELDTRQFVLRRQGQPCRVEPQVFDLLLYLIRHRDRVVSREELLDELWAGKVVSESTLGSCIKAARQAVGDNGERQGCIATANRRGYRFIASVAVSDPSAGLQRDQESSRISVPPSSRPALAVLPFSHSHGNGRIEWLATSLGDDISILLARIRGFLVISRGSTSCYLGREYTIGQVGRELGVDYVVEGSVWESGQRLRISVQLLETATGRVLWADRTEIPAEQLAAFQDDVVRQIVGHIEPELNRAELATLRRRRQVDLDAWALYRQGHAILSLQGWNEESFAESTRLMRLAIARDPQLAYAHAYLSLILALGHLIGLISDDSSRGEALRAAETALALDGQDSDVLGYAGCALADLGLYERGIGLMQRAIELDPSNAQAHAALGAALLRLGKVEGFEFMQHGMRISPRDTRLPAWGALLARSMLSFGRVEDAIETARKVCRSDDKIFLPRVVLALALNTAGEHDGARAALDDARRIRPHLSIADIKRFASADEIGGLLQTGLLR